MRRVLVYIALFMPCSLQAQFLNNEGIVHIGSDALVAVKGTDFINKGKVEHGGYLLVDNNVVNESKWTCDSAVQNSIQFGGNWTNDSNFYPGIGTVNMIGDNQSIFGLQSTAFYELNLQGAELAVKSMYADIQVRKKLNLLDAELACNKSVATMTLQAQEIKRKQGFVSTQFEGRLNREFRHAKTIHSIFPLGHNKNGKIIYKPIVVTDTDSGTFRTAFIYSDPSLNGMNINSLDDSLCTVNDEYFHIAGADPSANTSFGLLGGDEYSWSKLALWEGPWTKITESKFQNFGSVDAFGVKNYQLGEDKAIVMATERPFVEITEDVVFVPNKESYEIIPKLYRPEHSSITWSPPDHLSCDDCPTTTYTAGLPNTYVIEIDNNFGCVAYDTIRIKVVRGEDDPTLIPNAFSPNFDGLNDIFLPHLYSFEELVNMSIYNRWGQKIYDGVEGWDGTFMGKPVQMGSYLYKIEIKELLEGGYKRSVHLSGILTIIR